MMLWHCRTRFRRILNASCNGASTRKHTAARWLSLIVYSIVALGIPVPAPGGPTSGEAFPCAGHRCGCHSAAQCWNDCCCMSMEEKLAWAEANDVTPPEYVVAAVEREKEKAAASSCPCCKPPPVKSSASCCSAGDDPSCCSSEVAHTESNGNASENEAQSVVLLEALKCQGIGDNWFGLSASVLPPTIEWNLNSGLVAWVFCHSTPILSVDDAPASPPPRTLPA